MECNIFSPLYLPSQTGILFVPIPEARQTMKILLTAILLCGCSAGYAQLREGSFNISSSTRLGSEDDEYQYFPLPANSLESQYNYTYRNLNINVGIHYFLKRNFSIGLQTGINYSNYTSLEKRLNDTTYLTRYNFSIPMDIVFSVYHPIKRNFYLRNQFTLGTSYHKTLINKTDFNLSGNAYYASYNFGFMWFPGKRIGINMALGGFGFNHYRYKKPVFLGDETIKGVSAVNFSLNTSEFIIGVNYFFGQ